MRYGVLVAVPLLIQDFPNLFDRLGLAKLLDALELREDAFIVQAVPRISSLFLHDQTEHRVIVDRLARKLRVAHDLTDLEELFRNHAADLSFSSFRISPPSFVCGTFRLEPFINYKL